MAVEGRTIARGEEGYPSALHELADPPERLHVMGRLPVAPATAIVGSREADRAGVAFARHLAEGLADRGVVVISGGARGVDQAAHEGALEVSGRTMIVLGCGLDVDYPAGSMRLRERAAVAGAVVTELDPGTPPRPAQFPRRNRIVAALADAVVVVQAGARSGALSTARLARELGRPLLAVPGAPGAALTRGTHGLLRRGAALCEGPADVLAAIGLPAPPPRSPRGDELGETLEGIHAQIHASLEGAASVVELELRGLVRSRGGCYERL